MSNDKVTTSSQFFPRPEAHSMTWDELLPPLRQAVRDLLFRLDGAVDHAATDPKFLRGKLNSESESPGAEITGNCFLVYGERGTGKTTVLLSARDAAGKQGRAAFFDDTGTTGKRAIGNGRDGTNGTRDEILREETRKYAENLNNVIWLDTLDLEPLPTDANFLTTVLTRVRNALCVPVEATSILEESADSARAQLDRLISDATVMWNNIEQDSRSLASRKIASAESYAHYGKQFAKAMEVLSRELARKNGNRGEYCPVILPIDNIDRSAVHLYRIVKMAQMVACPHLYLVMAGDREDVETFLERAYWKELIGAGQEAHVNNKVGMEYEGQALLMARRQAAAASHKVFPPSHRIKIRLVEPSDTLRFMPTLSNTNGSNALCTEEIEDLLRKIPLVTDSAKKTESSPEAPQAASLVHLFVRNEGEPGIPNGKSAEAGLGEGDLEKLTDAGKIALRLPARAVLDLWQLAYAAQPGQSGSFTAKSQAERLVRTMLRNIIAEGKVSERWNRCLQEQVIRRDAQERAILDFSPPSPGLKVKRLSASDLELRLDREDRRIPGQQTPDHEVRSSLTIGRLWSTVLLLRHDENNPRRDHEPPDESKAPSGDRVQLLPDLVAAWLAILNDILIWEPDAAVINPPKIKSSALASVLHEVVSFGQEPQERKAGRKKKRAPMWHTFEWPMPEWETFIEHDLCGYHWRNFLKLVFPTEKNKSWCNQAGQEEALGRVLAAGWVACALQTSSAFSPNMPGQVGGILGTVTKRISAASPEGVADAAEGIETEVMRAAASLYLQITTQHSNSLKLYRAADRTMPIRDWLEKKLPLLLSHLYVPTTNPDAKARPASIMGCLQGCSLAHAWKANARFILDDMDKKLEVMFPGAKGCDLGPFSALHEIFA